MPLGAPFLSNGLAVSSFPGDPAEPTRDDLLRHLATFQAKLAGLAAIEQAKGAIMVTYGLTADAAFELLRFHSQTRNVKLRVIATQLASLLGSLPTGKDAIVQFDRLIDQVTETPDSVPGPAGEPLTTSAPADMSTLWSQVTADQDFPAGSDAAAPPPGITIAGNVANRPLVYANEAFVELTGYPVADVLGRNCRFLQGTGTDPKHIAKISRALSTGREVSVVMRNYRSDGSPFLNRVSISPLRDPANQITHFIASQSEVDDGGSHPVVARQDAARLAPVFTLGPSTYRGAPLGRREGLRNIGASRRARD